ncbi:MAG: hypothetical protein ACUZ77_03305, partial [Candidatus Brocadiales bacterium]
VTIFGDGTKPFLETSFKQEGIEDSCRRHGIMVGKEEMGIAKARVVARLGRKLYESGEQSNLATLTPLYLRKPAPVEKLESKL